MLAKMLLTSVRDRKKKHRTMKQCSYLKLLIMGNDYYSISFESEEKFFFTSKTRQTRISHCFLSIRFISVFLSLLKIHVSGFDNRVTDIELCQLCSLVCGLTLAKRSESANVSNVIVLLIFRFLFSSLTVCLEEWLLSKQFLISRESV